MSNASRAPLPGEGEGEIPPRRHLRKLVRRLDAMRELEPPVLDAWRAKPEGPSLQFVEAYDKLVGEDLPALLDSLLGREPDDS